MPLQKFQRSATLTYPTGYQFRGRKPSLQVSFTLTSVPNIAKLGGAIPFYISAPFRYKHLIFLVIRQPNPGFKSVHTATVSLTTGKTHKQPWECGNSVTANFHIRWFSLRYSIQYPRRTEVCSCPNCWNANHNRPNGSYREWNFWLEALIGSYMASKTSRCLSS